MTCVIDGNWDGDSTLLSVSWPRARKRHWCGECGRGIARGEKYEDTRIAFDGGVQRYKTCAECAEIRDALLCSWGYGWAWEDIAEGLDTGCGDWSRVPWSAVATLSKPARDRFCDWLEGVDE